MPRAYGDDAYSKLKGRFRIAVKRAGGVECAAEITGLSPAAISNYQNTGHAVFPPVNVVVDLEREIGEPLVSREMVRLMEDGGRVSETNPLVMAARLAESVGRFSAAALEAYEDGTVSEVELIGMIAEMQRVKLAADKVFDDLHHWQQDRRSRQPAA